MKDKIIFWFGGDFTQFCMAYYFQKEYDCDMYSIVDITNKPKSFFRNQKLIPFNETWYLHDQYDSKQKPDIEYLKKFEEKYKINLWQLAINERFFYRFNEFYKFSTDEILSIIEQICRFYEKIFEEISPDFFITKLTAFHHLELFRLMCNHHGTKVLMLSVPKIAHKSLISENDNRIDYVNDLTDISYEEKNFDELRLDLEKISTKKMVSELWNKHSSNSQKNNLKPLLQFLKSNNKNIETNYNYYGRTKFNVVKNSIQLLLKKNYRESFMNKNFVHNPDLTTPYVYYAMSVILERGILIATPYVTNQNEVIRHLAKSLPVGYRLLVKEHPIQKSREWRPISEYKEIMDIPNVTLIHHSFSEKELLKNSSLVVSIAGSSSFEAAFFGKPSIVFSDLIYSYLSSVSKVNNIEDLPKIIQKSLTIKAQPNDLGKFLNLLSENLVDFDHFQFMFGDFYQHFYLNGGNLDSEIDENKLKIFLEEHEDTLKILSTAHIEKIKQHKQHLRK
tara:strand:+ start:2880 stop:4394 length:1515 start_codon:yes stop_codon:yes gene_type:complete